jgi:hypothetical protein
MEKVRNGTFTIGTFTIYRKRVKMLHRDLRDLEAICPKFHFIQSSRWKASETHYQQTYVNGFWLWIESYIREFRESKI